MNINRRTIRRNELDGESFEYKRFRRKAKLFVSLSVFEILLNKHYQIV